MPTPEGSHSKCFSSCERLPAEISLLTFNQRSVSGGHLGDPSGSRLFQPSAGRIRARFFDLTASNGTPFRESFRVMQGMGMSRQLSHKTLQAARTQRHTTNSPPQDSRAAKLPHCNDRQSPVDYQPGLPRSNTSHASNKSTTDKLYRPTTSQLGANTPDEIFLIRTQSSWPLHFILPTSSARRP